MNGCKPLRISLAMLLLLSSVVQGAQIIRYVDPDAAGAGDGTSWADAYTSASVWESTERTDLVAADDYHTCYFRSSGGTPDSLFTVTGWTTDVTHYIELIQVDDSYSVDVTNGTAVKFNSANVRIHNFNINATVTLTGAMIGISVVGGGSRIDSCTITGVCSGTGSGRGIVPADGTNIYNCVIRDFVSGADVGFDGIYGASGTWNVYNCTIWNCYAGIERAGGTAKAINCAVGNCSDDFKGTFSGGLDYCISDDGDGTNAQAPLTLDWDNEFVDANNGDFSLTMTGNTFGNGTADPGSGLYSDDIIDVARTVPWSIGAYEGGPAGESTPMGQIIMLSALRWGEPLCLETLR